MLFYLPNGVADRMIANALRIISDQSAAETFFASLTPDSTDWRNDANGR